MNAAAWIALGGAILVVLTNVVVITRFISALESQLRESKAQIKGELDSFKAQIKGELDVIRAERQMLVETTNVKLGQIVADHGRSDVRIRDLERIVGRSTNLRDLDE
jgi:hypothetical protein